MTQLLLKTKMGPQLLRNNIKLLSAPDAPPLYLAKPKILGYWQKRYITTKLRIPLPCIHTLSFTEFVPIFPRTPMERTSSKTITSWNYFATQLTPWCYIQNLHSEILLLKLYLLSTSTTTFSMLLDVANPKKLVLPKFPRICSLLLICRVIVLEGFESNTGIDLRVSFSDYVKSGARSSGEKVSNRLARKSG